MPRLKESPRTPRTPRVPVCSPAAFTVGLFALLPLACGDGGPSPQKRSGEQTPLTREDVPALPPDAEDLDPRVVQRIDAARAELFERLEDPRAWAELGMVFETERMRSLAVECYQQAAHLEPNEARWWFHVATAFGKLGQHEEAIASIERSIELEDSYAPSHARLGSFHLDRGELEPALSAFERAQAVDPRFPGGPVGIARVKLQMDEGEAALSLLQEIYKVRPTDSLVRNLLNTAFRQTGRVDETLPESNDALSERWPDPSAEELRSRQDDPTMRKVTKLLLEEKKLEALSILEDLRDKAQSVEEERTFIHQLADLYLELGRLDEAEEVQRRIGEIQPENSQVDLALADIYDRRGELPKAVTAVKLSLIHI